MQPIPSSYIPTVEQWGKTKTSGNRSEVTLPISFPHCTLLAGYCVVNASYYYGIDDISNNQFTIRREWYNQRTGAPSDTMIWGIGY